MANQKKAASPGYKTPNEKYNEEFAEESMATVAEKAKASRNAASNANPQSSK
ncbi:hypothetical protein [Paenibacillus fonticola]|uniref:hypothetical protein n=1 Tax=Paenibacillus fonticola TaxID=379896 RepID=UPI00036AF872|nr:hypothetical protein [Paenibacillus fonticola]